MPAAFEVPEAKTGAVVSILSVLLFWRLLPPLIAGRVRVALLAAALVSLIVPLFRTSELVAA